MKQEYYYSIWGNVLLFVFGSVCLFLGLDLLFIHSLNFDVPPSGFVSGIVLFLGVMTFSGAAMNLIKGKRVVIGAGEEGIVVFTGAIGSGEAKVEIPWKDLISVEVVRMRPTFRKNHAGHLTTVFVFKVSEGSIEWPNVMLTKNRIHFSREGGFDQIVVDAWLNQGKRKIAKELVKAWKEHDLRKKQ